MTIIPIYNEYVIYQGATFSEYLRLENPDGTIMDLTGKGFQLQARKNYYSPTYYVDISTENGGIDVGTFPLTVNGEVVNFNLHLYISAEATDALEITEGVYDLYMIDPLVDPVQSDRILYGPMPVSPEVTQVVL